MLWTLCIICSILLAPPNGALADVDQDIVAPRSVESVQAVLDDVTQLMEKIEDGRDHTVSSSALDLLTREVEGLTMELQRLEELTNLLLEKQSKVDDLIRTANSQQLEALMLRLNETLEKETKLREFERQEPKQSKRRPRPVVDVDTQSPVTSASLHRRIGIEAILDHSELEMKNWIVQVIQDELATLKDEFMPPFDVDAVSGGTVGNNSGNCPSTIHVVQKVQQALKDYANDGIGRVDHAQGAQVVHWWTSTTFSPPALSSETLGSVWWRKFIPEDWEKLLPDGWENWRLSIPSYLYHSLGFLNGPLAPPETILQKNTLPGACWPMSGTSGQVTLKLAYPVVVEAVSIDHVPGAIISKDQRSTAPKHIKVVGYPPCDSNDVECSALGFDMSDPTDIAQILYDVEGSKSVQTFESNYAKALKSLSKSYLRDHDREGKADHSVVGEIGSCSSAEATSCSVPPRIRVAGLTIQILENWGNPDYTCLYRVRVHGEAEG